MRINEGGNEKKKGKVKMVNASRVSQKSCASTAVKKKSAEKAAKKYQQKNVKAVKSSKNCGQNTSRMRAHKKAQ